MKYQQENLKTSQLLVLKPPLQNENFSITGKNLLKNRNWTFSSALFFPWKLELVSSILWMIVAYISEGLNRNFNYIGKLSGSNDKLKPWNDMGKK